MNSILTQHLDPVLSRFRFRRICLSLALAWSVSAAFSVGLLIANRWGQWYSDAIIPLSIGFAAVATICGLVFALASRMTRQWVAHKIEQSFPDLDSGLLTAVEQQPENESEYTFLQQEVIRTAIYHDIRNSWPSIVPRWQTLAAPFATGTSLLFVVAILTTLFFFIKAPLKNANEYAFSDVVISESEFAFDVEPGNTEVERGNSLLILARFTGQTPPNAFLQITDEDGNQQTMEMNKSLDDPIYAGRIGIVERPVDYRIQLEHQQSDSFHVNVFEFPKLNRADAMLTYPGYTDLPEKIIQDFRRFSAIEGTVAKLSFALNKPVTRATLVDRDGNSIELERGEKPNVYETEFTVEYSNRYELKLTDDSGRENQIPPRFVVNVLPNQGAKVKVLYPARDVDVSPIEELIVQAEAWDDFGLKRVGMNFLIPGQSAQDITLAENVPGRQDTVVEHLISFEALAAEPDQMLAYYFWAEDRDASGQLRRTSSDMFFANVRPFDEIYRQGQQPSADQQRQQQQDQQNQQSQQNAQQAQEAADMQKEIVNATWKIIRREGIRATLSDVFADDVLLLITSQSAVTEKVDELAQNLSDAQSLLHVENVKKFINLAVADLSNANEQNSLPALEKALGNEQAVLQALLKLRNREHQVVRQQQNQQQQQQQQGQQNNRQQQQLQQMQMSEDENRYENQQLAQPEQSPEEREDRQVLNRLRELAERQDDLNERVKELQSALEQAEDQAEKDEIEKQLKRLREEQQQILRDTDELGERMNQAENQQRMNEQSKQLDNARENIQKSAEALEKGEVSQAAAEGTRAQEQLKELENEFQKRTAGQFNRQVQQMRNQARDLENRQDEIAEDIKNLEEKNLNSDQQKSLRDTDERADLTEQIEKQKQDLTKLTESMKDTIEQAEEVEPLLAQELYETYRDNIRSQTEKALESTQRSLDQGWIDDASIQERRANDGIENLRKGIEKAATSVLGDETEALRRANQELDRARRELQNEVEQNDPTSSQNSDTQNQGEQSQTDSNQNPERQNEQDGKQNSQTPPREGQQKQQGSGNQKGQSDQKQSDQKQADPRQGEKQQGDQKGKQQGQQSGQRGQRQGQPQDQPRQPGQRQSLRGGGDPNQAFDPNAPVLNRDVEQELDDSAPLTGDNFREWSDRLRDVEEMVDDPELRAEAARIRERARAIRRDLQERHSKEPNWDLVRMEILEPLVELQSKVRDEIIRKTDRKSIVPIDRDPVPSEFEDAVKRYYKQLGTGK